MREQLSKNILNSISKDSTKNNTASMRGYKLKIEEDELTKKERQELETYLALEYT